MTDHATTDHLRLERAIAAVDALAVASPRHRERAHAAAAALRGDTRTTTTTTTRAQSASKRSTPTMSTASVDQIARDLAKLAGSTDPATRRKAIRGLAALEGLAPREPREPRRAASPRASYTPSSGLSAERREQIRAAMGATQTKPGVVRKGNRIYLGAPVPVGARS